VDYLTVAYADEGVELRKAGISLPIMVMNPEEASFGAITVHDLEPEIFSLNIFQSFQSYLRRQGVQDYPIHLKLDTGMHRLGFQPAELDQLLIVLRPSGEMRVKSVFSHLVASEDPSSDAFTKEQGIVFSEDCVKIESSLGYSFIKHIVHIAAIVRLTEL
jgi:alanine racemase